MRKDNATEVEAGTEKDALSSLRAHAVTAMVLGFMGASAVAGLTLPGAESILEPSNPVSDHPDSTWFGNSVALDGDVLVVGASRDDVDAGIGDHRGAVYVFQRVGGTWTPQEKLVAPDGEDGDWFGHAVDLVLGPPGLDDFLIVGAPRASRISADGWDGKVYLFRRSTGGSWSFDTQLFPDPATEERSSQFGHDVAIDVSVPANSQTGDHAFTAAVGSPKYEHPTIGGSNHGAVHVYQLVGSPQGWQQTHEFYGHNPQSVQFSGMELGSSVALDGGLIVAGAQFYYASNYQSGAGFLYGRGNQQPGGHFHWGEASRLEATSAEQQDWLGMSAAVSFDTGVAFLGARYRDGFGFNSNSGAVYVFDVLAFGLVRNEVQLLVPSDDVSGNSFGAGVDIDGPYAVIGAPGADVGSFDGAIYLFEQMTGEPGSWMEVGKISPSDMQSNWHDVGAAVGISGLTTAYGVPVRGGPGVTNEGAAYVNELRSRADLSITKTADRSMVANGDLLTYTVIAANSGPDGVTGTTVTDLVPGDLTSVDWTCTSSGGATCTASGTVDVDDAVDLPVGGAVTYTIEGIVDTTALSFDNTAQVAVPPDAQDDTPANDSATVTVLLCAGAANETVPNQDVTTTELYSAVGTLTAADVDVLTGGDLTLRACGTVILESGFSVQGGKLTVQGGSP